MIRINRQLNLVLTLEREDKSVLYVHATPIGSEVFDTYFKPISKAHSQIYAHGLGFAGAPPVAERFLKEAAIECGMWESNPQTGLVGVKDGLLPEIRRLTNVIAPGKNGWESLLLDNAVQTGVIDQRDAAECVSGLIFFSELWHMVPRSNVRLHMEAGFLHWDAQITSLDCTAFRNSLPTLTQPANSGGAAA